MFVILLKMTKKDEVVDWFPIWESPDGTDTAKYLKECMEGEMQAREEKALIQREYRMVYVPKEENRP